VKNIHLVIEALFKEIEISKLKEYFNFKELDINIFQNAYSFRSIWSFKRGYTRNKKRSLNLNNGRHYHKNNESYSNFNKSYRMWLAKIVINFLNLSFMNQLVIFGLSLTLLPLTLVNFFIQSTRDEIDRSMYPFQNDFFLKNVLLMFNQKSKNPRKIYSCKGFMLI